MLVLLYRQSSPRLRMIPFSPVHVEVFYLPSSVGVCSTVCNQIRDPIVISRGQFLAVRRAHGHSGFVLRRTLSQSRQPRGSTAMSTPCLRQMNLEVSASLSK